MTPEKRTGQSAAGELRSNPDVFQLEVGSYLLGRDYWVWTPHGLYRRLMQEPKVCHVDVSALLDLDEAQLTSGTRRITACAECAPGVVKHRAGAPKPFCMPCGRDLVEGSWKRWAGRSGTTADPPFDL